MDDLAREWIFLIRLLDALFVRGVGGSLVGSGWGFAGFYFLEEPDDAYAEEA
jgi:hypothetical protein